VFGYIDESATRVREDRENRERLEREAKKTEIKRLEAEGRLQQEMAANSERERARAEEDKQRAEASVRTSQRRMRVAIASTVVMVLGRAPLKVANLRLAVARHLWLAHELQPARRHSWCSPSGNSAMTPGPRRGAIRSCSI
jgi:hypothetical protein